MSSNVKVFSRGRRCRLCKAALREESERPWLCRGTGLCYRCARLRIEADERSAAARIYLETWRMALDTYERIAVGLKAGH